MTIKELLFAATAALAAISGPGLGMAQNVPDPIRIGVDVDAGTLDPRLARDTTAYRATNLIFDGLVQLSPGLEPLPSLAASWENPEPTVWIFHLRAGVTFQDGEPLTADDVVYTFTTILDPDLGAPQRGLYTPISMIEAVDPQTVKFTLAAPYSPLLSYLDIGIVPEHVIEAGGDLGQSPIGTGPMKLASWDRGSKITLAANEDFWGGAPSPSGIELIVSGDNTARAQAFEAGDLDFIQSPLSPQDVKRLAADPNYGSAIASGLGVTYININAGDPLLADPAMRRALAMLIDQTTIVEQIYEGVDKVATSVLLPTSWAYSDKPTQPGFDLEGAKSALAGLGWSDSDGDGVLDKDGAKLALTLATHSEDPNRVQSLEYLQSLFQQAGIEATLRITDWPSFSANYVQKGQHQIALLGWLNLVDPDRLLFGQLSTGGPLNWGQYSNADLDALLQTGRSSLELADRAAAYQEAAAIIANDVPYYIISYQGYQMFYDKDLGELPVDARGNFRNLFVTTAP